MNGNSHDRPNTPPLAPDTDFISGKAVNARKGNRLPREAGLKLLSVPRAPKERPVTALLRNAHGVAEWKLFLNE